MLQWKSDEFCGNPFTIVYLGWRSLSRFDEESGFGFLEYLCYGDRLVLLYPWHRRPAFLYATSRLILLSCQLAWQEAKFGNRLLPYHSHSTLFSNLLAAGGGQQVLK